MPSWSIGFQIVSGGAKNSTYADFASGPDILLQVRCAVLDNRLERVFREWLPNFRLQPAAPLPVMCRPKFRYSPILLVKGITTSAGEYLALGVIAS